MNLNTRSIEETKDPSALQKSCDLYNIPHTSYSYSSAFTGFGEPSGTQASYSEENQVQFQCRSRIPLWAAQLFIDSALYIAAWMIVLAIVENTPDPTLPLSNGEVILPWVYGIVSVFAAIFVAVTAFVIYFRQEPEIVSRNVLFITQVIVCTFISILARLMTALLIYEKLGVNTNEPEWNFWFTALTQIGPWGLLMVVSAVTLRLRVIYKIWICNDLNTSYGFGLIYHIPISIVSVAVPCAIRYAGVELNHSVSFTGAYLAWGFFLSESGFYLHKIWPIYSLFVDLGSNVRISVFALLSFLISCIYGSINGLALLNVLQFFVVSPFCFLIFWLEIFGPSIMKIVGRQAGKYWLETVDLSGMAHEIQGNCVSSLGFVLSDPQLYERLVWICQRRYCAENLYFLKSMMAFKTAIAQHDNALASSLVGNIIEVHVTRPTLDMEINISAPSKKVLEEYMELGVEHKLSQNLLAALIAVEERVTCLLMPSMAEFFVDPVVVAHYKKIQASERAGLRLMVTP